MNQYILKDKTPVQCDDLMGWQKWMGTANRRVARTKIGDADVSTIFLGIDHSFALGSQPILFETMVFGGELDQEQDRYCTWNAAEIGHQQMCERVRESQKGETNVTPQD